MRIPRALLLMLALLQAAGVVGMLERASCETQCQRDGCDDCAPGDLAPVCDCHCPATSTLPARIATLVFEPARLETRVSFDRAYELPLTPDPFEILHVPRLRDA